MLMIQLMRNLRGVTKEDADDSCGALKDFTDASLIAPGNLEYQKELRRILTNNMIMIEE